MGACNSCEATAVAAAAVAAGGAAAKVVFVDGQLHQFPEPTLASQVVKIGGGGGGEGWFLCSADELELGGAVAAVAPDEELQPGQLYFVLPAAMRRRRLRAEEMAALAVKASAALVAAAHDGPLVFPAREEPGSGGAGKSARRSRRGSSRGRDFVPDLGAIAE